MKTSVSFHNPSANIHVPSPANTAPPTQPVPIVSAPPSPRARFDYYDFHRIVAPLTSFLAATSKPGMLDTWSTCVSKDPHPNPHKLRISYRLDVRYFTGVETTLDEHLFALMRASRRGRTETHHPIAITTEFSHQTDRGLHKVWSALVISVSRRATKEECLQQVKRMLLFVLRPGNVRPLDPREQRTLGRSPSMN